MIANCACCYKGHTKFVNKILGFKSTVDIKIFVRNKFLFLFVGDTNSQKLNSRGVVLHLLLYYL